MGEELLPNSSQGAQAILCSPTNYSITRLRHSTKTLAKKMKFFTAESLAASGFSCFCSDPVPSKGKPKVVISYD